MGGEFAAMIGTPAPPPKPRGKSPGLADWRTGSVIAILWSRGYQKEVERLKVDLTSGTFHRFCHPTPAHFAVILS